MNHEALRFGLEISPAAWIGFHVAVVALLALDLLGFNRKAHRIRLGEAAWLSAFFVAAALVVNAWVWWRYGSGPGLAYLTGYLVEKSLSVDNLFVFAVLFRYFGVPAEHQHRVLFWGIFGALVMRAIMIFAGVALIERFDWVLFVFGGFLIVTGLRMLRSHEAPVDPTDNRVLRLLRRALPLTSRYHGQHFFAMEERPPGSGRLIRVATPLFLVLVMIELTDVVFAVDSIPAILGITTEPFLVYSSNVMAIIGLRALYFLLAGVIDKFKYLHVGLSVVLVFIGLKMIASPWFHIPTGWSLGFILVVLTASIAASYVALRGEGRPIEADRPALDPTEPSGVPPPAEEVHE